MLKHKVLALIFMLYSFNVIAFHETYTFDEPNNAKRFEYLIKDFRCVTCQNQNLADSNAPIAESMRDAIYQQINSGKSDQDIQDFLVGRYGEFVLYNPPFKAETLILWLGPGIFLLIALGIAFQTFRSSDE